LLRAGTHEALVGLAAAVPDALTVTSLTIDRNDGFTIEAIVVGSDFDPEATRQALEQSGFKLEDSNGWQLNAPAGKVSIRGKYAAPRP
jgi:hypothetical protein